ncbi:hypothetical protein [Moorena sp. SIO4G3]|uniref:hypothetical protein n=1 Tax=Moorena sp. SIO4G3 TaxID=2607821 RepID=UPI0025ED1CC4|nr:hypothetical protein [Moorena sp. SIO4G3]
MRSRSVGCGRRPRCANAESHSLLHLGASDICCVTRWVEWAWWWNGHQAWNRHRGGTGIVVERASCPLQFPGGLSQPGH